MKETFDNLQSVFPEMPKACQEAMLNTAYSVQEKQRKHSLHPAWRFTILIAAMLAVTITAGAAFFPRIISWFTQYDGQEYGAWMEKGAVALPEAFIEQDSAAFTVDEVLTNGCGLYVLGIIKASDGYVIVDSECSAQEPCLYIRRFSSISTPLPSLNG